MAIRHPGRLDSLDNHPPEVISNTHPFGAEHSVQNSMRSRSSKTRNPITELKLKECTVPDVRLRTVTIRSSGSYSVRITSGSEIAALPNVRGFAVTLIKAAA